MVEHDRHRRGGDEILDRRYHRQAGVDLDMPAARPDALDAGLQARPPDIGIAGAAGGEIEPDAADAGLVHGVELAIRRLVVDHGDAARGRTPGLHAEQRGGVIGAVDARRHDHHALHPQRLVQCRHFLGRRQFRRVDPAREERKFGGIRVNMGVAVTGTGGNLEIHRRRRLCRGRKNSSVIHGTPAAMEAEASSILRRVSIGVSPCILICAIVCAPGVVSPWLAPRLQRE